jgi:hypothetical protein
MRSVLLLHSQNTDCKCLEATHGRTFVPMRDQTTWSVTIIGLYRPTRSVGLKQTGHVKFRQRILVLDFTIKRSVTAYIRIPTSFSILVAWLPS